MTGIKNKKGMTLVEVVIALAVATVLVATISGVFLFINSVNNNQKSYIQAQDTIRTAALVVEKDIRSSSQYISVEFDALTNTYEIMDNTSNTVIAEYRLQGETLYRNGSVLIDNVTSFTISQELTSGERIRISISSSHSGKEMTYEQTIYLRTT